MIIKRAIAVESLTKVCEESLNLIKQLIDADNETYGQGYEDGMAAQAKVQQTLKPWAGLTDEEIDGLWEMAQMFKPHKHFYLLVEAKLREKNNA